MSTKIYKYGPLQVGDNTFSMPFRGRVLKVDKQGSEIFVWAEVDFKATEYADRIFKVYATGSELNEHWGRYQNTVVMDSGLVWHIYGSGRGVN